MKFSIITAALATLVVAAPVLEPEQTTEGQLEKRQTLERCPAGVAAGRYRCYHNTNQSSWYYGPYIAVCGSDGFLQMVSRCSCREVNGQPYCY